MGDVYKLGEGQSLAEFLQQHDVVGIKVGATWCEPCRRIDPQLPALAEDLEDRLALLDLDIDQADPQETKQLLGDIMGVPTAFVFRHGERIAGSRVNHVQDLKDFFCEHLSSVPA